MGSPNEITQKAYQACSRLYREYGGVLALLLVLQLVTYQKKYALVVIGHYQDFERSRYVRVPNSKHSPHVSSFAFAAYRQSEILNYFFGKRRHKKHCPFAITRSGECTLTPAESNR